MARRVLIIGGVAAGPKVAARLRRLDPEAEITMVERGKYISYAGCGMPFYLDGQVREFEELFRTAYRVPRDERYFAGERNIRVLTRTEAIAIDRGKKRVLVRNLQTGVEEHLPYDQLVLCTGAEAVVPPFEGLDLKGVYRLKDPGDAQKIMAGIDDINEAVVVGAGFIGIEVAGAFANRKILVSVVELYDQVMPNVFDADMARLFQRRLEGQGIEFYLQEKVLRFEGDENGRVTRVITDKREIDADAVVVAVGVRPNVKLARDAGLAIGETGAIAVNEYMQTSDPNIYAAGDCVETVHRLTGQKTYVPLASTANRQARVVADNIAGREARFKGILGTSVLQATIWNAGRTGLTEKQARELGFEVVTVINPGHDRSHYHPDDRTIIIKLVVDQVTGVLLGVQALGAGEVAKRIDVAATALNLRATVDDLVETDLGYCPPFNSTIDPLQHAANVLRNKLDGLVRMMSVDELKEKLDTDDDFIILDVRDELEFRDQRIEDPRVWHIPITELRSRLPEIPRDKQILAICDFGTRSYEAARMLEAAGCKDVRSVEGGMRVWPFGPVGML
ncbi:MAG: FAD-dependent oxidoreductase [Peptococcaceae bacterium]|nr:FAD-dependent oxidoreductase [Peptococcaceae bacterium]